MDQEKLLDFKTELIRLVNKYSLENMSDTPDFIIAEYLVDCLVIASKNLEMREEWFGRHRKSAQINTTLDRKDDNGNDNELHRDLFL